MMLLNGCVLTNFKPAPTSSVSVRSVAPLCPELIQYTDAQQQAAADELERIPVDYVMVKVLITDYSNLRAKVRVCAGK